MIVAKDIGSRLALTYDPHASKRFIAGKSVIIHCHHYNSRLQETIYAALGTEGHALIADVAESVFAEQLTNLLSDGDSQQDKWQLVESLYSHLGFGKLDTSRVSEDVITASSSHYVEGYAAAFPDTRTHVCHLTRGYLQAALMVVEGEAATVRENLCGVSSHSGCSFEIERGRRENSRHFERVMRPAPRTSSESRYVYSPNVDEKKIVDTLVAMPIYGDEQGLIPAFNVYLANMPADFYNLLSILFVERMGERHLANAAAAQLVAVAEICGMNTFRGIMSSPEWDVLVAPMLKAEEDTIFAIIAVSNALGWGQWGIREHVVRQSLVLQSTDGYESEGYRLYRTKASLPSCWMLLGVSAGIMQLVYGEGTISERYGQYTSEESDCCSCDHEYCLFTVEVNL